MLLFHIEELLEKSAELHLVSRQSREANGYNFTENDNKKDNPAS